VKFARKGNSVLPVIIVFGVVNEEFEGDENTLTNNGNIFQLMNTIYVIIKTYFSE